jgi:hypothetical protein
MAPQEDFGALVAEAMRRGWFALVSFEIRPENAPELTTRTDQQP